VRRFLSFLGIEDIEFVYAEGLAMGDASRTAALESAEHAIDALTDPSFRAGRRSLALATAEEGAL